MVIALERYLIPMASKNHETSYQLALNRICTMLTKGWFRQFAIDNYPRLSNIDKDLLSIAHDIINNHSLRPKDIIHKWKPDPETQAIFNIIYPHTKVISSFDNLKCPSWGTKFTDQRSGLKITSPVNNISITAIITVCLHDAISCHPRASWSASVVILPSENFEILR